MTITHIPVRITSFKLVIGKRRILQCNLLKSGHYKVQDLTYGDNHNYYFATQKDIDNLCKRAGRNFSYRKPYQITKLGLHNYKEYHERTN